MKLRCLSLVALVSAVACVDKTELDYSPSVSFGSAGMEDRGEVSGLSEAAFTRHFGASTAALEERVYWSDVVVKARFVSAGDDILRFRAISYMKGTGPAKFTVQAETEGRDTQWDNQDAILFLETEASNAADFNFTDTTSWNFLSILAPGQEHIYSPTPDRYTGNLPQGYTLGTNNPVWVPVTAQGTSQSGQRAANAVPDAILVE